MALCGMAAWRGAVPLAVWATVRPPASLTALTPSVPSLPAPERMTAMARSPWSWARLSRKVSIGWWAASLGTVGERRSVPPASAASRPAGTM